MSTRLIIDGNAVYEIDEDCEACRRKRGGGGSSGRIWKQDAGQTSRPAPGDGGKPGDWGKPGDREKPEGRGKPEDRKRRTPPRPGK